MKFITLILAISLFSLSNGNLIFIEDNQTTWRNNINGLTLPYLTNTFLEKLLTWDISKWHIFQWDMGNGTSTWLSRNCEKLITVTPCIEGRLDFKSTDSREETIKIRPLDYRKFDLENGGNRSQYVECISETSDQYDCIIINGLYRLECLKLALNHIKTNGIVVVNNMHQKSLNFRGYNILRILKKYPHFSFKDTNHLDWHTDYWIIN